MDWRENTGTVACCLPFSCVEKVGVLRRKSANLMSFFFVGNTGSSSMCETLKLVL
jgi:hypothetical protein